MHHYQKSASEIRRYLICKLANETDEAKTTKIIKQISEISKSLHPDQKIVLCHQPITGFAGKRIPQEPGPKPMGLWYSCGNSWIEWNIGEGYLPVQNDDFFGGKFIYEVFLNKENILCISSYKELLKFDKNWKKAPKNEMDEIKLLLGIIGIDWERVAQSYSGIEICPYIGEARKKLSWYYPWDTASGCIWDSNAFKDIKLIASRVEGEEDAWQMEI